MSVSALAGERIRRSINHLAEICDFASSRDNAGFSSATATTGHELAKLPDRYWELGTYALAAQLVTHHVKQVLAANLLDAAGAAEIADIATGPAITKDQIPAAWAMLEPEKDKVILSLASEDLALYKLMKRIPGAYQPAGRGRVWAVPGALAFALDGMLHGFECEEGVLDRISIAFERSTRDQRLQLADRVVDVVADRIALKFEYHEHLVDAVKRIPGRRWETDHWTLPLNAAVADFVRQLVDEHAFVTTERSDGPVAAARNVAALPPATMSIVINDDVARISFPYNAGWVRAIKELPGRLRKYDPDTKSWLVTLDEISVDQLLEEFSFCPAPVPDEVLDVLRQARPYSLPNP